MHRRAIVASGAVYALALALLLASFSPAIADDAVYPGKLGIAKAKNLSPREREVEAKFAAYLENHTDEAIARYREK